MAMPYTLTNKLVHADTTTAVLVRNLMDGTPTRPCTACDAPPPPEDARFVYYAWQYLNPSPEATESFTYNSMLSVVVRTYDTDGTLLLQSRQLSVQIGSSYTLAIQQNNILLQFLAQNGNGYVEIVTPPPNLDPYTVEIDWYLNGSSPVAATLNVAALTSAYFQPANGTLLFLPVPSGSQAESYSVEDAAAATSYLPPDYATNVQVLLQLISGTQPLAAGYVFSPPQAQPFA
jgi:hypothetical protein